MKTKPIIYALDLESTLTPEIWITVAQISGIEKLRLTTRDVPDYRQLMNSRIETTKENSLTLSRIQEIIKTMEPLPGAREFLLELKRKGPVVILSDTFYQFAMPLIEKFDFPALFCHTLSTDEKGFIKDFHLRENGSKKDVVRAFRSLGFEVVAIGDSFNDTEMLKEASKGYLIHAPELVAKQFPEFLSFHSYNDLLKEIKIRENL